MAVYGDLAQDHTDKAVKWDSFVQSMGELGFTYNPSPNLSATARWDSTLVRLRKLGFAYMDNILVEETHSEKGDPAGNQKKAGAAPAQLPANIATTKDASDPTTSPQASSSVASTKPPGTGRQPKDFSFPHVSATATNSTHQLFSTAEEGLSSMKWEKFGQLMRARGFEYDPSSIGSSVRFDPPNPKDVSITFHKPHPDPTIHPVMLREFVKKLQKAYGWSETDFLSAAASLS